ncbi:hypothetical protein HDU76_013457 [Blyttiomyces sp. JEL0837]|nr:hypothetical protein HDU76_013457 [Blyttiomyces sp. JEL0837]
MALDDADPDVELSTGRSLKVSLAVSELLDVQNQLRYLLGRVESVVKILHGSHVGSNTANTTNNTNIGCGEVDSVTVFDSHGKRGNASGRPSRGTGGGGAAAGSVSTKGHVVGGPIPTTTSSGTGRQSLTPSMLSMEAEMGAMALAAANANQRLSLDYTMRQSRKRISTTGSNVNTAPGIGGGESEDLDIVSDDELDNDTMDFNSSVLMNRSRRGSFKETHETSNQMFDNTRSRRMSMTGGDDGGQVVMSPGVINMSRRSSLALMFDEKTAAMIAEKVKEKEREEDSGSNRGPPSVQINIPAEDSVPREQQFSITIDEAEQSGDQLKSAETALDVTVDIASNDDVVEFDGKKDSPAETGHRTSLSHQRERRSSVASTHSQHRRGQMPTDRAPLANRYAFSSASAILFKKHRQSSMSLATGSYSGDVAGGNTGMGGVAGGTGQVRRDSLALPPYGPALTRRKSADMGARKDSSIGEGGEDDQLKGNQPLQKRPTLRHAKSAIVTSNTQRALDLNDDIRGGGIGAPGALGVPGVAKPAPGSAGLGLLVPSPLGEPRKSIFSMEFGAQGEKIKEIIRSNALEAKYDLAGSLNSLGNELQGAFITQYSIHDNLGSTGDGGGNGADNKDGKGSGNKNGAGGAGGRSFMIGMHPRSVLAVRWEFAMSLIYFMVLWFIPISIISIITTIVYTVDSGRLLFTLRQRPSPKGGKKVNPTDVGGPLNRQIEFCTLRESQLMYLKANFWIDLITLIPWELLIPFEANFLLMYVKMIRLRYLPKILGSSPYYRNMRRSIEEFLGVGQAFSTIFSLGGILIAYLHLEACGLFMIGRMTGYINAPLYSYAVFQSVANTFPLAYKPTDSTEQWIVIGTISSFSFGLDASARLYKQKMDEINDYLEWKCVPDMIRKKVRHYLALKYRGKWFEERPLLNDLNESLRHEISMHNCKDLITKVPFLNRTQNDGRDNWFYGRIATSLVACYYVKGDIIVSEGQMGNEMFFILQGNVYIIVNKLHVATLKEGQYFGEIAMIAQIPRTATVLASGPCILYKFARDDFQKIIDEFEDVKMNIAKLFNERVLKAKNEDAKMQQHKNLHAHSFTVPAQHLR